MDNTRDFVKGLASLFGVEAKRTAVHGALNSFKAALEAKMDEDREDDEELQEEDVQAAKTAAGVETEEELRAVLDQWIDLVTPKPTLDSTVADSVRETFVSAQKSAPAVEDVPMHSKSQNPDLINKVRSVSATGRAEKPTMKSMIRDLYDSKTASYEVGPLGGYVVRQEVREDIIPLLRAQLVVERAGASVTMLPDAAQVTIPRMLTAPDAYWVADGPGATDVPASDGTYGVITLNPKPLAARVRMPLRFLGTAFPQAEARIRDEVIRSLRLAIDYAALMGTGSRTGSTNTGAEPLGLLNRSGVTQTALGSGNGAQPTLDDLLLQWQRIAIDNIEVDETASILMHPRDAGTFERMTDTTGQPLLRSTFVDGVARQVINGKPVLTTTQIPTTVTLGTSSDTSYIFSGVFRYMELVMGGGIEIVPLREIYASTLQMGFVAYTYADVGFHYEEAFDILTGVRQV